MALEIDKHLWFKGLDKSEVAKALGISESYFRGQCTGRLPFQEKYAVALSGLLGVSAEHVVKCFDEAQRAYVRARLDNL